MWLDRTVLRAILQGWPQSASHTLPVNSTEQVIYMHTRLIVKGVLRFYKERRSVTNKLTDSSWMKTYNTASNKEKTFCFINE
jgi:hypothetical protein